uniref:Leishmanolysin-like peptidase n=1 Tax=Rhabditophanes sp. KR3021 TaxID=114890 RepID=A0AC35TZ02_9BILA
MEIREQGEDTWIRVPAESCGGLRPSEASKRKMLNARHAGSVQESIAFPCTETFESFCLTNNDYFGMYMNCRVVEPSCVIHLEP